MKFTHIADAINQNNYVNVLALIREQMETRNDTIRECFTVARECNKTAKRLTIIQGIAETTGLSVSTIEKILAEKLKT